jgi:hypothetical protein
MEDLWKHILLLLMLVESVRLYWKTRETIKQRHKLELELLELRSKLLLGGKHHAGNG